MARDAPFTEKTARIIAQRVAYRCSYLGCGQITIGPGVGGPDKVANAGTACHIVAASPTGPRARPMSATQRRKADNGIWMCATHGRLIDADDADYTIETLRAWKEEAERRADGELKGWLEAAQGQLVAHFVTFLNGYRVLHAEPNQEAVPAVVAALDEIRRGLLDLRPQLTRLSTRRRLEAAIGQVRKFLDRWKPHQDPFADRNWKTDYSDFFPDLEQVRAEFRSLVDELRTLDPRVPEFGMWA